MKFKDIKLHDFCVLADRRYMKTGESAAAQAFYPFDCIRIEPETEVSEYTSLSQVMVSYKDTLKEMSDE